MPDHPVITWPHGPARRFLRITYGTCRSTACQPQVAKNWVDGLNIPATQRLGVTGYSLGGHLAAAFHLLHIEGDPNGQISRTYAFNAAGVGDVVAPPTALRYRQNSKMHSTCNYKKRSCSRDYLQLGYSPMSALFPSNRLRSNQKLF